MVAGVFLASHVAIDPRVLKAFGKIGTVSVALSSCRQTMSGSAAPSQSSRFGRRRLMLLMLKVAIFMRRLVAAIPGWKALHREASLFQHIAPCGTTGLYSRGVGSLTIKKALCRDARRGGFVARGDPAAVPDMSTEVGVIRTFARGSRSIPTWPRNTTISSRHCGLGAEDFELGRHDPRRRVRLRGHMRATSSRAAWSLKPTSY
jgi:hypothetical protein